jgi:hypothetical protein
MTPMGGWCYDALQTVKSNIEGHCTACEVLKSFYNVNQITLPDAAAMVALHPERRNHMFYQMPVFQLDSFRASVFLVG